MARGEETGENFALLNNEKEVLESSWKEARTGSDGYGKKGSRFPPPPTTTPTSNGEVFIPEIKETIPTLFLFGVPCSNLLQRFVIHLLYS